MLNCVRIVKGPVYTFSGSSGGGLLVHMRRIQSFSTINGRYDF